MKKSLLLTLALALTSIMVAQPDADPKVIQFSGIVVTGDSLSPVPYTSVFRERDNRGTITDFLGFFSLPTYEGDTIKFSCVGYREAKFVIPDTLSANRYNVVQFMRTDTVQIAQTFIYPWPSKEKFKEEFLALDLPYTEEERAQKNLESVMMYDKMVEMGADGAENYQIAVREQTQRNYWAGQTPPLSIFNPIAWAKFIEAWKAGDFKGED